MPSWITRGSQPPESTGSIPGGSAGSQTAQSMPDTTPPPYSVPQQLPSLQYATHSQASSQSPTDSRSQTQGTANVRQSQSQGYWDPVRDAQRSNPR
ncbi:hypothetical protein C1H76_4375 [Elsinoe australis]|uniref:Uncharacterized protein n=1 Tax=Elsinoe australis TaxID=40998 RepID=A0A4U7AXI2_9PEZI|nr:hypothetical protein C1H76_4375 [Elsinoe australis]